MATRFATLIRDSGSTTNLRAWAQFVEDTLVTTGGWVVTTDTGQTAPGSLVGTATANAKQGFRIYRMNDSLQATAPVFMRIDFGTGGSGAIAAFWVTIGTGSDGAGNITGFLWNGGASAAATVLNSAGGSISGLLNSYGSAANNRVSLGLFVSNVNTYHLVFTLERTKDATGADTSSGLLAVYIGNLGGTGVVDASRYIRCTPGAQATAETGLSYALTMQNPTQSFGGFIGAAAVIHFRGIAQQPGTNVMIVNQADVGPEGSFSMSLYGATRTYQQLNAITPSKATIGGSGSDTNARVCIRYD